MKSQPEFTISILKQVDKSFCAAADSCMPMTYVNLANQIHQGCRAAFWTFLKGPAKGLGDNNYLPKKVTVWSILKFSVSPFCTRKMRLYGNLRRDTVTLIPHCSFWIIHAKSSCLQWKTAGSLWRKKGLKILNQMLKNSKFKKKSLLWTVTTVNESTASTILHKKKYRTKAP